MVEMDAIIIANVRDHQPSAPEFLMLQNAMWFNRKQQNPCRGRVDLDYSNRTFCNRSTAESEIQLWLKQFTFLELGNIPDHLVIGFQGINLISASVLLLFTLSIAVSG